jgi:hypothetical protein
MATPPVFSAGAVLTAAQMNAIGLWRVTTCTVSSAGGTSATASNGVVTIGTNNTSVTVSNAFSSDFDAYKIIINGGTASTAVSLRLSLGASVTGYSSILNYATYAANTTPLSIGDNNAAQWSYVGYGTSNYLTMSLDIINPFAAKYTQYIAAGWPAETAAGMSTGIHTVATSFTSFVLTPNTGNISGGTIRVYGYRQ